MSDSVEVVQAVPAAPSILDAPQQEKSVDDFLLESPIGVGSDNTKVQNINLMANSLEQATNGELSYQQAMTNLMTDGGYNSKTVRDAASALYVRDLKDMRLDFDKAAAAGMVERAATIAQDMDTISRMAEVDKEKAITKVTKEAATNLVTANVDKPNDVKTMYEVSDNYGTLAGVGEILDQYLVKNGLAPSKEAFLGTLGVALGVPLAAGFVNPVAGLISGIAVGSKFSYDSFVTVPDAIEKVSGIKKGTLSYAEQINVWRQQLATMSKQEALNQITAVADYIAKKEQLPGEVGKVFTALNLLRLTDQFDENEWSKLSLSLKTQELLDRVGLGFDAAGALRLVSKAFSTAKIASETLGGAAAGRLVGDDIVKGTSRMGADGADQAGYALSLDLKQFLPDGSVGLSASAQKELQTALTKTLETLDQRIRVAEDAEAIVMRDFVVKNAEKYNGSVAAANLQTGELVLQHPSGAPFRNVGNAKEFAAKMEAQTGLKFEVVGANDAASSKLARFDTGVRIEDTDSGLVSLLDEAESGVFDPFGVGRLTAQSVSEVIKDSAEASVMERALAKMFSSMSSLDNVKVVTFDSANDLKRLLPHLDIRQDGYAYHGKYEWRTNTIYLQKDLAASRGLVLHETMHAAVSQVVDVVRSGDVKAIAAARISNAQKAAVKNIQELYKDVQWQISRGVETGDFSIVDSSHYGMKDMHEMISEGLTNPEFQKVLQKITLSDDTLALMKETDKTFLGTVKTAWDAFTKTVMKALGLSSDKENAFSRLIEESARLLKSVDVEQQSVIGALRKAGVAQENIAAMMDSNAKAATALSHGWYVRHAGAQLAHTTADIESRFGGGLDPVHRASELAVHERTMTLMQEQKDRNALKQFLNDGFKGLSRKQNARVISVLEEGDTLGKEFNVVELAARGLSTDKEKRAYFTYRTLSNLDLAIKNTTLNENLTRRGFVQGYIRDGLVTHFAPAKVVNVADEQGRKAYNLVTKQVESVDAAKIGGHNVVRTAKPVPIGGSEYTLFISDNTSVSYGRLRPQIPNKEGSFRHYYTQDYFGNVTISRTINGEVVEDTLHLRTSNSGKDIVKWKEGMDAILTTLRRSPAMVTQSFIESKVGKWEDAAEIYASIGRGEWDKYKGFGHHFDRANDTYIDTLAKAQWDDDLAKSEGRGIRLKSIDTDKDNILDPIKAITAELTNVARHRNIDAWRDKWVQTWWNSFKDGLPEHLQNSNRSPLSIMSDPSIQLSTYTKGDQFGKFAESQRQYILAQLGVKTLDERLIESAMRRFTDTWSADSKIMGMEVGDKLITAGHALRNADPLQFIRSFNFFTMLSAFNPAQLIVQGAGAVNAIAVSPMHGLKAAYTAPLLRVALASDNPAVWDKLATLETFAKAGLSDRQEFISIVRAIKKTGLLDGIVSTSMHSAEAGQFNMFTGFMNKVGEKSAFFFNRGEEFSRLTAFEVARREFKAANPSVAWNSDAALRWIVTRADDFTQNMTRSNLAFYQRGVLSIPGQFLQYNIKLAANLAGATTAWATGRPYRGYTMSEAMSIAAAHTALYGLAGNGMMKIADEVIGGYEKLTGKPATDDEKLVFTQGLIAGLVNELSQLTTGEDTKLAIGSRLGVFEYYEKLAKATMSGTADFWSVVLGPSYGSANRLGALKGLVDPIIRKDLSVGAFADAFNNAGKEIFSGWKSGSKALYAQMHDGSVPDKEGNPMVTITKGEIIAQAIGIGSSVEQDYWRLQIGYSERKKAVKEFVKSYLDAENTRLEVLKNEGESKRYNDLTNFMASLHYALPAGEKQLFWDEVTKERGTAAAAPFIDKQTKLRADILRSNFELKDVVNTRSRDLTEHAPMEVQK